jgi:pSer/pThr/pTyr-binding forkhead associated (FHA) protein
VSSSRVPSAGSAPRHKLLRLKLGFRVLLLSPGTITIGRRKNCDLVLDDPQTSREHARVIVGEQSAAIQDLGSGNGVLVNGTRISGLQRLSEGDRIQIGVHTIEVLAHTEPASPGPDDTETTVIGLKPTALPTDWVDEGPTRIKKPDRA